MTSRKKQILAIVGRLLIENKVVRPPVRVERIARKIGARIVAQSLDDGVSGFVYKDKTQSIIGVNTYHSRTRQRFTIAHELGHLLLENRQGIHVDQGDFLLKFRNEDSSKGTIDQERDANLFAAELLLPRGLLEKDVESLNAISVTDDSQLRELAKRYEVSLQALLIRLSSMGIPGKAVLS
jgi:Zn-dependent peptidase ImmA (M78 family)